MLDHRTIKAMIADWTPSQIMANTLLAIGASPAMVRTTRFQPEDAICYNCCTTHMNCLPAKALIRHGSNRQTIPFILQCAR